MKNHNIISVSGCKDSTATLLLAIEREVENLSVVFADTGHEHPDTYEYLDYLETATSVSIQRIKPDFSAQIERKRETVKTKWRLDGVSEKIIEKALNVLQPTGIPFLDMCMWKGRFPSSRARFCTTELKVLPIQEVFREILSDPETGDVYSWQGVRADESIARSSLPELDEVGNGLWNYRPILKWTAGDVFDFHRKHGVKWNPLYEQGMGRVGCMPCIHVRKSELQHIAARFPDQIERVAQWERLVSAASKRGVSTFTSAPGVSDVSLENHGIHNTVEWSKTTHGGRQYDLIASSADNNQCSSAYGLCD